MSNHPSSTGSPLTNSEPKDYTHTHTLTHSQDTAKSRQPKTKKGEPEPIHSPRVAGQPSRKKCGSSLAVVGPLFSLHSRNPIRYTVSPAGHYTAWLPPISNLGASQARLRPGGHRRSLRGNSLQPKTRRKRALSIPRTTRLA